MKRISPHKAVNVSIKTAKKSFMYLRKLSESVRAFTQDQIVAASWSHRTTYAALEVVIPLRILVLKTRAATESPKKGIKSAKSMIPMALILVSLFLFGAFIFT